jgi:hypothetical protein
MLVNEATEAAARDFTKSQTFGAHKRPFIQLSTKSLFSVGWNATLVDASVRLFRSPLGLETQ